MSTTEGGYVDGEKKVARAPLPNPIFNALSDEVPNLREPMVQEQGWRKVRWFMADEQRDIFDAKVQKPDEALPEFFDVEYSNLFQIGGHYPPPRKEGTTDPERRMMDALRDIDNNGMGMRNALLTVHLANTGVLAKDSDVGAFAKDILRMAVDSQPFYCPFTIKSPALGEKQSITCVIVKPEHVSNVKEKGFQLDEYEAKGVTFTVLPFDDRNKELLGEHHYNTHGEFMKAMAFGVSNKNLEKYSVRDMVYQTITYRGNGAFLKYHMPAPEVGGKLNPQFSEKSIWTISTQDKTFEIIKFGIRTKKGRDEIHSAWGEDMNYTEVGNIVAMPFNPVANDVCLTSREISTHNMTMEMWENVKNGDLGDAHFSFESDDVIGDVVRMEDR